MAYIITNPNLVSTPDGIPLGGYAMLFNVTRLVLNSAIPALNPGIVPPVDAIVANTDFVASGNDLFR